MAPFWGRTSCTPANAHAVRGTAEVRQVKRLARRLAETGPGELRFRCREKASVAAEALQYVSGRASWRRGSLRRQLLPTSPQLEQAVAALDRADWSGAGAAVRSHFARRAPRFVIDPACHQEFVRTLNALFPGARDEAVKRADRLASGRYDLLGYRDLSFGNGRIDWHFDPVSGRRSPATFWTRVPFLDPWVGDHKVIWELNRHQHWLALGRAAWLTGDSRYVHNVCEQLESWLQANPPLTGINWSSMLELGFRCLSWIWALHLCAALDEVGDATWFIDLLEGLDRQLDHIARHLSVYFSPNTHLLGEALALYVGGRVVPELRSAARWERIGRDLLVREGERQVHSDGGHVELSTHYHRYTLDFYLLALAVARKTGDPAAAVFEETVSRLATFCRALADDRGHLPTIGDDDGGTLFPICGRSAANASASLALAAAFLDRGDLPVGAAPEEVLWMAGGDASALPRTAGPTPGSRLFPETGYAVLRSAASHAILDTGRHGFLNGGHAHADALSLVLSVGGRPLLIDPGTVTYTMDPSLRDRFRSTAMHNTVTVDGRPQSVPSGPFHWAARTDARTDLWRAAAELDCAEATHNGYAPLIHRRCVLRVGDRLWLIADHLLGSGRGNAATHWHFHSEWTLSETHGVENQFVHGDGLFASLASTAIGPERFHGGHSGLGWSSPVYGRLVPSTSLRYSAPAEAPATWVTAIAWNRQPVRLAVRTAAILPDREDGWHRAAVSGTLDDTTFLALFAVPRDPGPAARAAHRVAIAQGQLTTDARIAVLRLTDSGDPLSLSAIDGRFVEWQGRGDFRISPAADPTDIHLDAAGLNLRRAVPSTIADGITRGPHVIMNGVRRVG